MAGRNTAGFTGLKNTQAGTKDFNEFKSSLMTVDEFRRVSKDVPLAKTAAEMVGSLLSSWGDTGAILWFLYGSVRSGQEGFDFITPLLMIGIPAFWSGSVRISTGYFFPPARTGRRPLKDTPDRAWDRRSLPDRHGSCIYF